jgi:hypothetical protein
MKGFTTKQSIAHARKTGLLRFARNDAETLWPLSRSVVASRHTSIVRTARDASRCLVRRDRPAATQALSQASDPTLRSREPGAKPFRANNFRQGGKGRARRWINASSKFPRVTRPSLQSSSTWATFVVVGGNTAGRQRPRQLSRHFNTNKPKNFRRSFNGQNTLLCIY